MDILHAIGYLRDMGKNAIVLEDRNFEFARDLADGSAVMNGEEIVMAGSRAGLEAADVQRHIAN